MLSANGSDEIALMMQGKIIALTVQDCIGNKESDAVAKKSDHKKSGIYRSIFSIANETIFFYIIHSISVSDNNFAGVVRL